MKRLTAIGAALILTGCGNRIDDILALEGDLTRGQILYESRCASCHGLQGQGVSGPAMDERVPLLTGTEILETVLDGIGQMPAFGDDLSDQQLSDLLTYLQASFL